MKRPSFTTCGRCTTPDVCADNRDCYHRPIDNPGLKVTITIDIPNDRPNRPLTALEVACIIEGISIDIFDTITNGNDTLHNRRGWSLYKLIATTIAKKRKPFQRLKDTYYVARFREI